MRTPARNCGRSKASQRARGLPRSLTTTRSLKTRLRAPRHHGVVVEGREVAKAELADCSALSYPGGAEEPRDMEMDKREEPWRFELGFALVAMAALMVASFGIKRLGLL